MLIDLQKDKRVNETYKLMSQTIIPRPIAWAVTEDEGVINIAPFSYFTALSSSPASVLISVGHKADGTPKDTLFNIRKHQKCTICMVEEKDLEKMHLSSKSLDKALSEAEIFHIETVKTFTDYPPMIKGVASAYFCTFNQEIDLEGSSTIPLVLNVKHIFVDDRVITDTEHLNISFSPVARTGRSYAFLGEDVNAPFIS